MTQVRGDTQSERYIVVSADSHVGPSLRFQLREYCPARDLDAFDEFARLLMNDAGQGGLEARFNEFATDATTAAVQRSATCPGLQEPTAFLSDMDSEGIAASMIFAGGGNGEPIPWIGGLIQSSGAQQYPVELQRSGARIWNRWLADFTATAPGRLLGVAQLPFDTVDAAISEIGWAKEHGLRALNFPAPKATVPAYNDPVWEPFWAAVVDSGLPLVTHGSSGDVPQVYRGNPGSYQIFAYETRWLSRRGLSYMMFGGVFERHPELKLVFTEQRADWVGETLRLMDSIYSDPNRTGEFLPPKKPSEYWHENCYIGGSFLARYEFELRDEIGLQNLLWGSDYPHPEGTWPRSRASMRKTFAGASESSVRMVLGLNAIPVFSLDAAEMRQCADRIGPTPAEIAAPLGAGEYPEHVGLAFRDFGAYA
jgi:predicted TIM-barrel fold metal-dependent hydrolase